MKFSAKGGFYYMTEDLLKVKQLLEFRGCNERTIKGYLNKLKRFINLNEGKDIKNFTEQDIIDFLTVNFVNVGKSPITINGYRTAIKLYYMVNWNKEFSNILLPMRKRVIRYPKILSNDDIMFLINNENNLKHKAWLSLAYGSGLRVSEIASLNINDFSHHNKKIKVIGKGNKERYTIFPDFTYNILLQYYNENKNKILAAKGYLFPCRFKHYSGLHMTSRPIQNYFLNIRLKYNLNEDITFHTLRHSFATEFIKNGGDITKLRLLMGHSSYASTIRYIHMAENYQLLCSPIDRNNK